MTKTKGGINCCIEVGNVKQYLLLRRHDIQTDKRDRHGNTASTTLLYYLLWATRVQIPPTIPEPCRLLQTLY